MKTYRDLIAEGATFHGDRTALVFGGESRTFYEVDTLANQLAHGLIAEGVKKGDMVALLINNGLNSVPVDFACVKSGVNRVPLNSRLSAVEHQKMLRETGATTLLYGPDLAERAAELQDLIPGLVCHGIGSNAGGGKDLLAEAPNFSPDAPGINVSPEDVVLTTFTSGTTGTLKAAQHTQGSYAGICLNMLLNLNIRQDDVMLHAASLIHASGVFVLPFWLRGGKAVIMSAFEPDEYLDLIEREEVTSINMVPTMMQMLLENPKFAQIDVSRLRRVIYGASPMPRPVIKKAMGLWGADKFQQYYGQTECPMWLANLQPHHHLDDDLLGACGRPSPDVEIRLVDEDGNDTPKGEPGEIAVRGPMMMKGYFNAPDLNAETFMDGGWLRTRDVGVFDDRGFLHLKDRTSDMIITGGYNVYPREIEDILISHPAVLECAVVGLKDDKWVEAVTAAVVRRDGHDPDPAELIGHVAEKVASYKKPQRIIFLDEIPKTAVGKLNRKVLRETLQ